MKKKLFLFGALLLGITAFGGCSGTKSLVGETSYEEYGTLYGIKVKVDVDGETIKNVTILDSDYTAASPESSGWDSSPWDSGLEDLLSAYKGKTVDEILAREVAESGGKPLTSSEEGFKNYGEEFIISGATLSSGRLILAIQNALQSY